MIDPAPNTPDPFPIERPSPDLVEFARQTLDYEAFLSEMREVLATGGYELKDFIADLEAKAPPK